MGLAWSCLTIGQEVDVEALVEFVHVVRHHLIVDGFLVQIVRNYFFEIFKFFGVIPFLSMHKVHLFVLHIDTLQYIDRFLDFWIVFRNICDTSCLWSQLYKYFNLRPDGVTTLNIPRTLCWSRSWRLFLFFLRCWFHLVLYFYKY